MDAPGRYSVWMNNRDIDDETHRQLATMSDAQIQEHFSAELDFGTAGIRGRMGVGTGFMNSYVVRRAAAGLARLLTEQKKERQGVVIAYDTRCNSSDFANAAARTICAAGVRVHIFREPAATPLLCFALVRLGAAAGIVITASHNTSDCNGFKVFDHTGCQLDIQKAAQLAEAMRECSYTPPMQSEESAYNTGMLQSVKPQMIGAFLQAASCRARMTDTETKRRLHIVYTPLHGTGAALVPTLLYGQGYTSLTAVEAQMIPDGRFPTVKTPNPEVPETLEMAIGQARSERADLVLATDPDCDRVCAAAADSSGIWRQITGSELGGLLLDYLSERGKTADPIAITTVVTGGLGPALAAVRGMELRKTLTGFKHIGAELNRMTDSERSRFLLGYEESCGYLIGSTARDKDAATAALVVCEMAAYYKAQGLTLPDRLRQLHVLCGWPLEKTRSISFAGANGGRRMIDLMQRIGRNMSVRQDCCRVLDYRVGIDNLPPADLIRICFSDGSWLAVRPSGTEPRLKLYFSVNASTRQLAQSRLHALETAVEIILQE